MTLNLLIALAAGAASALMFSSLVSGALISLALFYLAPLPLMVAALGFSALGAALGGLAATIVLAVLFGLTYALAFLIGVALPAWWLGHLALLARDDAAVDGRPATVEWYPLGRLVVWIAGVAALTTMAALFTLGLDSETINDTLRRGLMRVLGSRAARGEADQIIDAIIAFAPAAAAIVSMLMLTLNLWLAAKITAISGRLTRPWPELSSVALPRSAMPALCIAVALSFTGGLVAMAAKSAAAALTIAYALHGLAALHTLVAGSRHRLFWLITTYAVVLVFGWPALALVALGLVDAVFDVRSRKGGARLPPTAPGP